MRIFQHEEMGNKAPLSELEQQATKPVQAAESATPDAVVPLGKRSEAARKGAERIKELIRLGEVFEREHGVKHGRERRRRLIELGKRYEVEHGLVHPAKHRPSRTRVWADFILALSQMVRPEYRRQVEDLAGLLAERPDEPAAVA